jgi:hypothetical protein
MPDGPHLSGLTLSHETRVPGKEKSGFWGIPPGPAPRGNFRETIDLKETLMKLTRPSLRANVRKVHIVFLLAACLGLSGAVQAQNFQSIPALSFTMPAGSSNALPQIVTVASTGTAFPYYQQASTSSGGNWLSAPACSNANYPCTTPFPVAVNATATGLSAGTYQGKIVFTDSNNKNVTMTVNVSLTVTASSAAYFDNLPGALSFSLKTGGINTPQPIQIRNGGSGTLSWSLTTSTGIGSGWLTVSATSGSAPSTVSIGINTANLPSGSGTYVGQLLLTTSGDSTTIPVSVTVGTSVFEQVNPISFTMPGGGNNPLPQILPIDTADNSATNYYQVAVAANGGNWLSVPFCSNANYPCATPHPVAVNIQNASTLAAGTYIGEVTIYQDTNPQMSINVPVTLNVISSGAYFNNLPGQVSFSMETGGTSVPQTIQVTGAGSGSLNWTVGTTTADGGAWLTASPASGTAPSDVIIGVNPANLPNGGSLAGTFVGQLLFQTSGDATTIPVAVTVGTNVFNQVNPISFTMPVGSNNPLPQLLTVATTVYNSPVNYYQVASTATGGNWLSVPACSNANYPCTTPYPTTVNVQNASTLPAGVYTGEVTFYEDTNPAMSMTVPVTLNIVASGAFFNNLPGQVSFSMVQNGTAVPQTIEIENAGSGTLDWTVTTATSDGGEWLSASPTSGKAPSEVSVSVNPAHLPGGGSLAGTFTGQLLFQTGTDISTIPVTVTVGTNVFDQVNPISFTMPAGGANPLPQILTINNSVFNSALNFYQISATATGGNWLSVPACSNANYPCNTPYPVTVNVQNASTLPAGAYTGEVTIYQDTNPQMSVTVPVTLNVEPSGAFFNNVPGQLSFTMPQSAKAVTAQALEITNAGSGKLKFTIAPSTSDGGAWLKTSVVAGSTPKTVSVEVLPANLPGAGALAGTYVGQILLVGGSDTVTIPVTVTVGNGAFTQLNPLNFVMPAGGTNPLPQVLTVPGIGNAAIHFYQATTTATGGNWLSVVNAACSNANYPCTTPYPLTVSIVNANKLGAGVYTGQVTVYEDANPAWSVTAPVTLTVVATSKAFFDNTTGQSSFSLAPGTKTAQTETIDLGNGGAGTLNWSVKTNTADAGKWLKVAPTKGSNSGSYTVTVTPSKLPGAGKNAGTFIGQEVLAASTGSVTIPVAVTVNSPVFTPVAPLVFNTSQGGNPTAQTITIASSGTAMNFYQATVSSKGGNWLSITSSACSNPNYPCSTPTSLTVNVASSSLAVGTYYAEIIIYEDTDPSESMTIPVVLNVT